MSNALRATLRNLEALARKVGAEVRYDAILLAGVQGRVGRGGLCRIGDKRMILCDAGLPLVDKVSVVAEALAELNVDYLHLPPLMRARIQKRPARVPKEKLPARDEAKRPGVVKARAGGSR